MKRLRIVSAVIMVGVMVLAVGCSPGRNYHRGPYGPPPPPPPPGLSLILSPRPGLVISVHPSGRYYYRDPRGRIYWRGADRRFYLDRKYIRRSDHSNRQYGEWRRYYRRR